VTPSDDLSPQRRPIFFPVVIATVFLTIIGLTAGFVLGERHNQQTETEGDPTPTLSAAAIPEPYPSESPVFPKKSCPPETLAKAKEIGLPADLRQVMRIQTYSGTTVWICTDSAGGLYYQSKTGGLKAKLVQDENGLLLSGVVKVGPRHYEALSSDGNRFVVTEDRLRLIFADGKPEQSSGADLVS
jgi:hypothetical protein